MIISAAIRKDGKVYTGKRHHDVFALFPDGRLIGGEQGFATDTGCFVDRVEGMKIARMCNQLIAPTDRVELYSEDIY